MSILEAQEERQKSYEYWNQVLISHFIDGSLRGTKIYLSVDVELIKSFGSIGDFTKAVANKVVKEETVDLNNVKGTDQNGVPQGVAFLGLSVFAAYQMEEQEDITDKNYFKRLREVLGIPGEGRPRGMSGKDSEEQLWKKWNIWLLGQELQPSAEKGQGAQKYINYPISQCLLRQTDKDRLQKLFIEKQWKSIWDEQTLFTQIRCQKSVLTKYLQSLIEDGRRHEAIAEAFHDIYEQWQSDGYPVDLLNKDKQHNLSRNLFAGIYRTEDPFSSEIKYYLYPKQRRRNKLGELEIKYLNNREKLTEERPGWYIPLSEELKIQDLEKGLKYQITSTTQLEQLILPAKDFWIFIEDPDNPDSGVYASWKRPDLGMKFILLCKQEVVSDMESLKHERLLDWDGDSKPINDQSTWLEFSECLVISQAWDGVFIKNQELKDFLKPTVKLSIYFSGGLHVHKQTAWLEGYLPSVTIFGFSVVANLQIIDLDTNVIRLECNQKINQPELIESLKEGIYLVKATHGKEYVERIIRIISWKSLDMAKIETSDEYSSFYKLTQPIQ